MAFSALGCGNVHGADENKPTKIFRDPAPPVVQKLEAIAPPAAKPHPDVTFHAKPKPPAAGAVTHDWKSFLGPTHNAVSTETKLLGKFPGGGPKLLWEMRKGTGYSSPAIAGERLVYMHRVGGEEIVECLRAETGERYWRFAYPTQFEDRYGYNNGPRASPVIDGDFVYTYGAEGKLHCLRLETGQVVWKRNLRDEFRLTQDFFGTASTPLVEGPNLIINVGAPGGPTVAAFDKASGKMVWGAGESWGASYASPVPATVHGKRRVFVFAGGESQPPTGGLLSIDPATGKIDFAFPWRSRTYESVNASSPLVVGNQVFISATYRTGAALLNLLPDGGYEVAWENPEFDLHWTHAIHQDGYLYAYAGRNEPDAALMAVELKTGRVVWREVAEWEEVIMANDGQRTVSLSPLRGSLLRVDGRFLALGELGHLLWLDLTPKGYREISRARLFLARETWSLPVLSRGLLYVSQHSRGLVSGDPPRLLCYDLRAAE